MNTENKSTVVKPISLVKEDFTNQLIETCNNSGLPLCMIEYILKDLLQEIHVLTQRQLEIDKKEYENQLSKLPNSEKDGD